MRENRPARAGEPNSSMEDESEYDIAVTSECELERLPASLLRCAIKATLARHRTPAAQISLALVDDNHIAQLNGIHLDHDGPTDVLTFDLSDRKAAEASRVDHNPVPVEGEIVVSVDTAAREAKRRGHGIDAELALYAVHGTLHLLGYDDHGEADSERMHRTEDVILESLGLGPIYGGTGR